MPSGSCSFEGSFAAEKLVMPIARESDAVELEGQLVCLSGGNKLAVLDASPDIVGEKLEPVRHDDQRGRLEGLSDERYRAGFSGQRSRFG